MTTKTALSGFLPPRCSVLSASWWLRLHRKETLWSPMPTSSLRWPAAVFNKQGATMYRRLGQAFWCFCSVPFRLTDHTWRTLAYSTQEFARGFACRRGGTTAQVSNLVLLVPKVIILTSNERKSHRPGTKTGAEGTTTVQRFLSLKSPVYFLASGCEL